MKYKNIFIVCLILLVYKTAFTQAMVNTSTSYNYADININSFPIDRTGATATNYESDYLYSGLYICQKIASTIKNYPILIFNPFPTLTWNTYPKSFTINNPTTNVPYFNVTISDYCKSSPGLPNFNYRMIFVRPYTTSPTVNKLRTIIINNGIGGDISNWANLYHMGVHDFIMRGYAVAYIENVASNLSSRYDWYHNSDFIGHGCLTSDVTKMAYSSTQSAIAAAKYLAGKENEYGVDKNQIYAIGHSYGSGGIYGLAYAKQTDFPNMETMSACSASGWTQPFGNLNNLTLDSYTNQTYTLKSIGIWGGAFPKTGTNQGDIFDITDKNIPAIILHGANDNNLLVSGSTTYYSLTEIKNKMISNTIPFGGYITCDGHHEVLTYNGMPDNLSQNTNITSGDVQFIQNNNFLNPTHVGKPYTATAQAYFNTLTPTSPFNTSPNMYLSKYIFFGKQVHDLCRGTTLFFNVANICSSTSDINACMNAANPTLYNNFLPAKTISFPFAYPNGTNGFFTTGSCSTLVNLKNTEPGVSSFKLSSLESERNVKTINDSYINVFPTPAQEVVNINFGVRTSGNISIYIYDILGKEITSIMDNQFVETGQYSKQLNTSDLANGMYKIIMYSNNGEIITKKIIIAKNQ